MSWPGPRARRRITLLAILAVAVGAAVYHLVDRGGGSSKQPHLDLPLGENNLGIAYGARPTQVVRRLGQPSEKVGQCWIYKAPGGKVNGHATLQGAGVDAMKYCFAEDAIGGRAVSNIEWHFKAATFHKTKIPAHWGQPEYIGCNAEHPCVPTQP